MKEARSQDRNVTASAISSGSPRRFMTAAFAALRHLRLFREIFLHPGGANNAGRHRIYSDALRAVFRGGALGKDVHPGLGGSIGGVVGLSAQGRVGGDVDDRTTAIFSIAAISYFMHSQVLVRHISMVWSNTLRSYS